jgi:hypothetical protein
MWVDKSAGMPVDGFVSLGDGSLMVKDPGGSFANSGKIPMGGLGVRVKNSDFT